ncbi:MAG TPA: cation diffusion facilitator family transporter [Frankiaceae bacterium]|jgi:cation diffusion facilitator family transporter|nr:cation diffusion facilitator family transporter [Frankiaceae bacterium]
MAAEEGPAPQAGSESRSTVLLAFSANLVIAIAKSIAGAITLSSAMLAEAAHSWADTLNQIFLLTSLRRSARPADSVHPFGYGKERFFWTLLAAVGIFVTGAGFSVLQGISSLLTHHKEPDTAEFTLTYVVLAVSFVLEGTSLLRALRQVRSEARERGRTFVSHLRRSNDPTVKAVASEDGAAVVGILLATLGIGLHQATGSAAYDAAASITIGVLLAWVAYALGRDTKDLLIGESADPELRLDIQHAVGQHSEVDAVLELLTMQLSPDDVLVAMRIDFVDGLDSQRIEQVSTEIEQELTANFPTVRHVFLDATKSTKEQRELSRIVQRLAADDAAGDPEAALRLTKLERERDPN